MEDNFTYQTSNDCAHVEDSPEPCEVSTLGTLVGIGGHDSSLRSPQETGTDTEKTTGGDVEGIDMPISCDQKTDGVKAVAKASKRQRKLDTQYVDECATEETEDSERAIESCVLVD
jgi:hypothetical protein